MRFFLAGSVLAVAAPALAQDASTAVPGAPRVNQLIVYGDDACPQSSDEEIIVCARKPESDRYRIPQNLRGNENDPGRRTWADRANELSYVGRSGIGSCSPVGPGGMIGCYDELVRQAMAERQTRDAVNWNRLIEQARQERLGRIDADAEAVERELREQE